MVPLRATGVPQGYLAVITNVLLLDGETPHCWVSFRGIDRENISDMMLTST